MQHAVKSVNCNNKTVVICLRMMESVKANLLAAYRYLLKPLVRLAVRNAVAFREFSDVLKQAYVDVATRQLVAAGKEPSIEGISLIAHLEATEIRDVLNAEVGVKFGLEAQKSNPLPTILAAWHTDVNYTGPYGVLRDIEFSRGSGASEKSSGTFTDLAAAYCLGISPRALLDELIRTGCVQDIGNGYYRALKRSYIPDPLSRQSILSFARVVHNICETLEVNFRAESIGGKGLIERTVYTVHGISKQDLKDFDKFIRARGQIFADDIDNWLSDRDKEGYEDSIKTGVGFYHYVVNDDDERALANELPH
jgi:Family of unknown function (DUF6502)